MAHKHSVYDTDLHFKIDPITRAILNMATAKTKIIQGDHNSERFTFEIPRLVDGHDMMLCDKIEVHYINLSSDKQSKSEDVYIVGDMQASPDDEKNVVIFSWLISGNATVYAGTLNFIIKFKCLTGETLDYAWSTEIYDKIAVSNGIDNAGEVITDNSDALESWKSEVLSEITPIVERAEAAANEVNEKLGDVGDIGAALDIIIEIQDELLMPKSKGLIFQSNGDGTCYLHRMGTCTDTDIVIPSKSPNGDIVTAIYEGAFYEYNSITSIAIPKSIVEFGELCFWGCKNLTTVYYEGSEEDWAKITKFDASLNKKTIIYNYEVW